MSDGTILPVFSTSWPNVTLDQARTQDEFNNRFVRRLVDIRTALLSLDSRLNADGTNIATNSNDIATAKTNISNLTSRVDSLAATWNALQTDNAQFKQDVQTTVTGFQGTVSVFQGNITALTKQLNDASANIAELQRIVDPALLQQVITAYNNAKNEIDQAVTTYDTNTVQPALAKIRSDASQFETRTLDQFTAIQTGVTSNVNTIRDAIATNRNSIDTLSDRVSQNEGDIAGLNQSVNQNANDISDNKSAQDAVNTRQTTYNTNTTSHLGALDTTTADNKRRITQTESDIAANLSAQQDVNSRQTVTNNGFNNRITTLETATQNLDTKIDAEVSEYTQKTTQEFSTVYSLMGTREQESKARDTTLQTNIDNSISDAIRREGDITSQQTSDVAAAKARENAIDTASQDRDTALDQKFTARTDAIEAAYKAADTSIRQDVQNGNDAQTASLRTYADEGDQRTLTSAKNYTDTQHDDAVNVAHAYTDTVAKGIIDIATTADNTANNSLAIVTSLRDQVNDNTKRVAICESNIAANTTNIAKLRADVDTNTPRISANADAISALTTRVGAAETYIATVNHAPYMMTPADAIPTLEYNLATISSNAAYNIQIAAKTDIIVNGQAVSSGTTFSLPTTNNTSFTAYIWAQKTAEKLTIMGRRSGTEPYFTYFSTQTPSNV